MNKDFLDQLPTDDQPVAKKIQSIADEIQVPSSFQAKLESELRVKKYFSNPINIPHPLGGQS